MTWDMIKNNFFVFIILSEILLPDTFCNYCSDSVMDVKEKLQEIDMYRNLHEMYLHKWGIVVDHRYACKNNRKCTHLVSDKTFIFGKW